MKLYLRLIKCLFPYWGYILLAIVCMVLLSVTTGILAYLVGPVMKFLFTNQGGDVFGFIPFDITRGMDRMDMVLAIPVVIMLVALVKGISFFGQSYLMGYVGGRIIADMRDRLYSHIQGLSLSFFNRYPTGILISRVTNDVNLLQNAATGALASLMRDSFTVIVLAGVAIELDWRLSIVAFIIFPLSVYPLIRFGKKMRKASTQSQSTMGNITTILQEALTGIKIVKAFCMEEYEKKRFSQENWKLFRAIMKTVKVRSISPPFMEFLGISCLGFTIWYSAYRIAAGSLKPEEFVSFFAAVFMLYQPVRRLSNVNNTIQQGLAGAKRIFEILDLSEAVEEKDDPVEIAEFREEIRFSHVYFAYEKEIVLKDIDFVVKKGEIVAIVGMSGAGKTTIVDLIPRFYDVTGGAILIDGVNIKELSLRSLRSLISVVSQRTVLFNDTVRNNIAYGDIRKDDRAVIEAAIAANAHDFIIKLPDGYDTVIGEQGVRLSGGECQRISIARAILKDAPILILDEATSSLDSESEREVQNALNRLMKGRTVFVIAHRLSTVREADRIIVLSGGRIVEIGSHKELLDLEGEYARLYNIQFFDTEETPPAPSFAQKGIDTRY